MNKQMERVIFMWFDVEQRKTIEYIKGVKDGRTSFKPSHINASEREIENFVKGGRMPNEFSDIMSEISWKRELSDESSSSIDGDFFPIFFGVGSVLFILKKLSLPTFFKFSLTTFSITNGLGFIFLLAGALGTILFILSSILK
jgi:hypothetical protein